MSFRITVVPASTTSGKETVRILLQDESKPTVIGIYRDPSKAPKEFTDQPKFKAVKGNVATGEGLDFEGSDAVMYIPPPTYDGTDQAEHATTAANNIKRGLESAPSVKRLLLHSALGAQYGGDIGILELNHISDKILEKAAPEVVVIKPGYFYEIWTEAFDTIKQDPPVFYSIFSPLDYKVPMVSSVDVGKTFARMLLETGKHQLPSSPQYFNLLGPRNYDAHGVRAALEEVTGRKVTAVPIERDDLANFASKQVPAPHVKEFVGMVLATLDGGAISGEFEYGEHVLVGDVELVDGLRSLYTAHSAA